MVRRARGVAVFQAGRPHGLQHRLDMFEPAGPDRRRVRDHPRRIAVGQQATPHVPRHLCQLTPPGPGRARANGISLLISSPSKASHSSLFRHVPIQGRCLDAEPLGEPAHGQPVKPDLIEQCERGAHDLRLVHRMALPSALGLAERNDGHVVRGPSAC
jgi:hypothetical protein